MSLTVITHADCALPRPSAGHPERPERLEAALRGVDQIDNVHIIEAPDVTREQLLRIHNLAYLDDLDNFESTRKHVALDPDTHLGPHSLQAARRAAGAACLGVDRVMKDGAESVFAVVRPPGHHAETAHAMGFCFYNNIAAAAAHAIAEHGARRVVVCDFDVHHGNGTEEILAGNAHTLFLSSHQSPLYPGTGNPEQVVADNIVNAILTPESGSDEFRSLWQEHLLPRIDAWGPDLVLVSAGFDAHWRDPLAQLNLKTEDYYWIGRQLKDLARTHASGRLVAALEGGYDLQALEESVLAFGEGIG